MGCPQRLALSVGISEDELKDITIGSSADIWSEWDSALLKAAEELHEATLVSRKLGRLCRGNTTRVQMMEVVFAVGQYNLVAMYLNSLGFNLRKTGLVFPVRMNSNLLGIFILQFYKERIYARYR